MLPYQIEFANLKNSIVEYEARYFNEFYRSMCFFGLVFNLTSKYFFNYYYILNTKQLEMQKP
jgi:hypothetical protein